MGRKQFDGKNYDETLRKLETAWALDCTDAEAAALAEISTGALSEFLRKNPSIAKRKEQLKQNPILKAREALYKAIESGDGKLALKYLERKLKKEFSTLHELSGIDGKPLNPPGPNLSKIPTEKLKLIRKILGENTNPGADK